MATVRRLRSILDLQGRSMRDVQKSAQTVIDECNKVDLCKSYVMTALNAETVQLTCEINCRLLQIGLAPCLTLP
jgi:hypothetical protein